METIIDMTSIFPWRIHFVIAQSFAYFNITHAMLRDKYHPLVTFFSMFSVRLILSLLLYSNKQLNFLGFPLFTLICFVLTLFLTEGKIISKILSCIFFWLTLFCASGFYMLILGFIFRGEDYTAIYNIDITQEDYFLTFFINVVSILCVSFLFAGILRFFASRKPKQKNKYIYAYFSIIPVFHIFSIFLTFVMPLDIHGDSVDNRIPVTVTIYILMTVIVLFDCFFPFVVDYFEKLEDKYIEGKKELLRTQMNYQQIKLLKEEKENFRKIKHDYMNLTVTAKGFIEIGKPEKALDILNKTGDDLINISNFSICSNESINTIVYIKQKQAKADNISFKVNVNDTCGLKADDYSVCRLLHNIFDNALESAAQTETKIIEADINIGNETFEVSCKNSFSKAYEKGKNRNERGFGTKIIKDIIKNYEGEYITHSDDEYFYSELKMKNISI